MNNLQHLKNLKFK